MSQLLLQALLLPRLTCKYSAPQGIHPKHSIPKASPSPAPGMSRLPPAPRLTLYFSFANNTEALWNLHSGFLGSMLMALFKVSKAFSDFFSACWTWHTKREQFQKGKNSSSSAGQGQTLLTMFIYSLIFSESICPILGQVWTSLPTGRKTLLTSSPAQLSASTYYSNVTQQDWALRVDIKCFLEMHFCQTEFLLLVINHSQPVPAAEKQFWWGALDFNQVHFCRWPWHGRNDLQPCQPHLGEGRDSWGKKLSQIFSLFFIHWVGEELMCDTQEDWLSNCWIKSTQKLLTPSGSHSQV